MAKRISKILFIILLFSIPIGELIRIPFFSKQINILEIASLLFVIFSFSTRQINFDTKLKKPVLIFCGVLFLSLLINFSALKQGELLTSFSYLVRWVLFAFVYFGVSGFDKTFKNKIPSLLVASGTLVLLLGIAQYFLYPNLRNLYYLGWDEHLYRLFSSFLDPNFAGAFLVLFLFFLLGKLRKNRSLPLAIVALLSLVAIILTYSRSSYIMFFSGLGVFLFMEGKKKVLFGFVAFFALIVIALSLVGNKSEGTNLFRTTSTQARLPSAQNALNIFSKNPILGVGFNSYEFASKRYGFGNPSKYANHSAAGTDNSFLFVLVTTGIVGFLTYLFMWFEILKLNRRSTVIVSSAIALFVDSLFVNSLFYSFIMIWMWILVAIYED